MNSAKNRIGMRLSQLGGSPSGSVFRTSKPFLTEFITASKNFGSSAVRGVLRGLLEMIAEIFRPLLGPIAR
jgi:hypothetical protein